MITFEQMLEAAEQPSIRQLDLRAFSETDVINIIMQRSETIRDQPRPGSVVRAWTEGDTGPARKLVESMGETLVRRAASIILCEFEELGATLDVLAPKSVADIGCGYAIFDYFLWQKHHCKLTLIDLETSEERHFGFNRTGAAYSNLQVAQTFLTDNGVPETDISILNPEKDDLFANHPVDLAVSFISCGFHYPVSTYLGFFEQMISPDGAVILDLRARKEREGIAALSTLGNVRHLTDAANGNARRVLMQKS